MQIQFPTALAPPTLARLAAALPWSANDILLAEVVGNTEENFTRLAIGNRLVVARTDMPLALGQKLALQVVSSGTTTIMKVLPAERPTPEIGALSRGLARVLPQQASAPVTAQLLRSLDTLAQDPQALTDSLGRSAAANLQRDIQALLQALPKAAQLTDPRQLRKLIEDVALPTEARLMSALAQDSSPDLANDLRAHFARVGADLAALPSAARAALEHAVHQAPAALTPATPDDPQTTRDAAAGPATEHLSSDLKTLVESVVARLEANQLQNMASTPTAPLPVLVDLPVARSGHADFLHLEAENAAPHDGDDAAPRTSVTLNLRLDGGHEFSARLQLTGATLSVRLGSTDAEFNAQIGARVGELEVGLREAGLDVQQIVVAPLSVAARPQIGARQLIDDKV